VRLPNEENFYMDDRAETELTVFTRPDICMENCKDTVEITMRARVLDVTPETEADASGIGTETPAATETAAVETAPAPEAAPAADPAPVEMAAAGPDPEMVAAGERHWRKCQACHQVGEGAVNRTGPELNDLVGRTIGSVEGFRYSDGFATAHDAGEVWTEEHLVEFLKNPRGVMPGTKMSFAGFRSDEEALQVLAYITAQSP
jgi:cytochrome c